MGTIRSCAHVARAGLRSASEHTQRPRLHTLPTCVLRAAGPFWRYIVRESTGCESEEMFEEVYQYFARPEAWHLAPGGCLPSLLFLVL